MRQQPITDDSFSEAEAMRIVRGLSGPAKPQEPRIGSQSRMRDVLARTVDEQVIPRLLQARLQQKPGSGEAPLGPHHVSELVRLLLTGTQPQVTKYIEGLQVCGVGPDALMLDLLTRTARRLGEMWEEDLCDFTQVTLGISCLNNAMRLVCAAFDEQPQACASSPTALLVQAPGEQHGLGLAMVVHYFRRAGWNVRSEPAIASDCLAGLVRQAWFDVVGISVSCSDRLDALATCIADTRHASCNPSLGVMVGGPPFIEHPQLAAMVGADSTAADAGLAVRQAQILISKSGQRPTARIR
jgi:methanogenic corrinoid protein MtbC1